MSATILTVEMQLIKPVITHITDLGLDPTATILRLGSFATQGNSSQMLESSKTLLPSLLKETESFGPKAVDIIVEHINDSCLKKLLDTKLKEFAR